MTKKNRDGFEPGQELSFQDLAAMRSKSASKPNTLEELATLKKGELEALLRAEGIDKPEGKVEELREQLTAILFPGS
jgi:hypothetical protein